MTAFCLSKTSAPNTGLDRRGSFHRKGCIHMAEVHGVETVRPHMCAVQLQLCVAWLKYLQLDSTGSATPPPEGSHFQTKLARRCKVDDRAGGTGVHQHADGASGQFARGFEVPHAVTSKLNSTIALWGQEFTQGH